MEQLLIYVLKSSLCISIFLMVYWLFLKKETFYQFNRHFLLSGLLASVFIPLIQLRYAVRVPFSLPAATDPETFQQFEPASLMNMTNISASIYGLGVSIFVIRQLVGLWKVSRVIKAFEFKVVEGCYLVETDRYKASFSIFKYIFLDSARCTSFKEQQLILNHELAHAKGNHWVDLLIAQLFCSIHWFNPLIWIYRQAIKQNHEFLADDEVLKKGYSGAEYRAALINQSLKVPVFNFSSAFAKHDQIKRMDMMLKQRSSPKRKWSTLLALPLLLLILMAFARPKYQVQVLSATKVLSASMPPSEAQNAPGLLKKTPKLEVCVTPKLESMDKKAWKVKKRRLPDTPIERVALAVKKVSDKDAKAFSADGDLQIELSVNEAPLKLKFKSETSNSPLYILDGIETDELDDSLSDRIESISVLKDATAMAMYGAKGANGVILITTKKATKPKP